MKAISLSSLAALAAASVALSACDGSDSRVAISYREMGICKNYDAASGPVEAAADQAFAVFKIETVDNTKRSKLFFFDPSLLYVDQSTAAQEKGKVLDANRRYAVAEAKLTPAGLPQTKESEVLKGTSRDVNGIVLIPIGTNNPSGGSLENEYDLNLLFDDWSPDVQPYREGFVSQVSMKKLNPAGTTYKVIEDCASTLKQS